MNKDLQDAGLLLNIKENIEAQNKSNALMEKHNKILIAFFIFAMICLILLLAGIKWLHDTQFLYWILKNYRGC